MQDSEREVLLFFLSKMRSAVVRVSEGLTEEQLRTPGVPSGTNILGLIQHLTGMEEHWFQAVFLGEDLAAEWSMQVPDSVGAADVVAAYRRACARSDEIIRGCPDLGTVARTANPGETRKVALRRIVTHMIEETGRHAGHADILREQIDNVTGL